ncbi:hypothetical protein SERLA73DRAFT_112473 [Serpula lacrymans var. lacrymans S7.3]|uniref:Uncharacterized protein n=2 Tax=Serpula lacrymans var. lacrymans TaxID=341189 RepID=F8Q6M8_SERL3|nr:uncharacterized protein SERLADRAFT_474695 [Serpula lacrymans var. lacrymans S7.9]EGN96266.1 hypothetical protein SERLA73DRAFT_112473 [Serpula lacrymans var. lacrymans S7.3]EGO21805.1 hypothetical protein SERLADRAFT_474695 [Serpula lacrymans var. lacrymans S7.9]
MPNHGKRKHDSEGEPSKRVKMIAASGNAAKESTTVKPAPDLNTKDVQNADNRREKSDKKLAQEKGSTLANDGSSKDKSSERNKSNRRKLAPVRPFPTVPTSVSATGPRSAHTEGKNYICITRKTKLGAYLRRCKNVFLKDGYKTLHMSAMGAAIPHLALLTLSLPPILPFPPDEVHTSITTGSVEVHDEVIPEDEDEDIDYQTRTKSTLNVVIKIGDGDEQQAVEKVKKVQKKAQKQRKGPEAKGRIQQTDKPEQIVLQEPEQDDMDFDRVIF